MRDESTYYVLAGQKLYMNEALTYTNDRKIGNLPIVSITKWFTSSLWMMEQLINFHESGILDLGKPK